MLFTPYPIKFRFDEFPIIISRTGFGVKICLVAFHGACVQAAPRLPAMNDREGSTFSEELNPRKFILL